MTQLDVENAINEQLPQGFRVHDLHLGPSGAAATLKAPWLRLNVMLRVLAQHRPFPDQHAAMEAETADAAETAESVERPAQSAMVAESERHAEAGWFPDRAAEHPGRPAGHTDRAAEHSGRPAEHLEHRDRLDHPAEQQEKRVFEKHRPRDGNGGQSCDALVRDGVVLVEVRATKWIPMPRLLLANLLKRFVEDLSPALRVTGTCVRVDIRELLKPLFKVQEVDMTLEDGLLRVEGIGVIVDVEPNCPKNGIA